MDAHTEILIIAIMTAITCAIPGVFLVLRRMSMLADAITHTVFLGIVIAFFITQDLHSPWLMLGATIVGIVTVWMTEALYRTRLVSEDASIGIIFPLLFSIAIILVSLYGSNVHLDVDTALLGEIAFAPFDRWVLNGIDMGPVAFWTIAGVGLLNAIVLTVLRKELTLSTFDPLLAGVFGFMPLVLHYVLMTLVSLTVVVSFQAVGAILVIGFMIGPAAMAYMITNSVKAMTYTAVLISIIAAVIGTESAFYFDVSIAGSIATVMGIMMTGTVIFAPRVGMFAKYREARKLRRHYGESMMLMHIYTHANTAVAHIENGVGTIHEHLNWAPEFLHKTAQSLIKQGALVIEDSTYVLTAKGERQIKELL